MFLLRGIRFNERGLQCLDLIIKGGVVLWTITLLSIIAIVIVIERYLYFSRIRTDEDKLFQRVKAAIAKGHFDEALAICDASPSPFGSLLRTGIEHRERSPYERKEALRDTAAQEVPRLEKNIGTLGTIATLLLCLDCWERLPATLKLSACSAVSAPLGILPFSPRGYLRRSLQRRQALWSPYRQPCCTTCSRRG